MTLLTDPAAAAGAAHMGEHKRDPGERPPTIQVQATRRTVAYPRVSIYCYELW